MKDFSYITNSHPAYIESLYNDFVENPESVDPEYRKFFEGFDFAQNSGLNGKASASLPSSGEAVAGSGNIQKEFAVFNLITAYRKVGHLVALTNPIRPRKDRGARLEPHYFGLDEGDLKQNFAAGKYLGMENATLEQIISRLKSIYCHHVGIEYSYIVQQERLDWLRNELESSISQPLPLTQKKRILEKLNHGVIFEKFLHTKYIGQKRFSLEGGETTIAALDAILTTAADNGVKEAVIGMAHRGRLNVLANILRTWKQLILLFWVMRGQKQTYFIIPNSIQFCLS